MENRIQMTLRLPKPLKEKVTEQAKARGISVQAYIIEALWQRLEKGV